MQYTIRGIPEAVDEAIREVLSQALAAGLKDPRIGFVTVTDVKTSPDLRRARVYVSVLGAEKQRTESLAGLLTEASPRRVGVLGFRELVSTQLAELAADGLELLDLEDDVGAFTVALPRVRVVPIERFDPWALLG